ncbi:clumping factor B-like [Amphiprion ocellaris]|uniref:clumping factor B-like n=1 Tax=Amphiprion ocellaris TaxID=80972 RepID=UPI0024114328|nr:clumping factor B-like [Amphiprion ocellaris]
MDKRKRDSSPAAEHPAKRPCTTSGSQRGGEEPSRPEVHAGQPQRSTSPQPSTSGSQQHPEEPQISPSLWPSTSDYDSDSVIDFNIDSVSDSDSDYESDSLLDFCFDTDLDSESYSDFQSERSSSPPMSNSAVQLDQAQQVRTSQQSPSQEEVPEDPPGMSAEPEPPPPGLQRGMQQEEPIQPVMHFPSGFPHSGDVEILTASLLTQFS